MCDNPCKTSRYAHRDSPNSSKHARSAVMDATLWMFTRVRHLSTRVMAHYVPLSTPDPPWWKSLHAWLENEAFIISCTCGTRLSLHVFVGRIFHFMYLWDASTISCTWETHLSLHVVVERIYHCIYLWDALTTSCTCGTHLSLHVLVGRIYHFMYLWDAFIIACICGTH